MSPSRGVLQWLLDLDVMQKCNNKKFAVGVADARTLRNSAKEHLEWRTADFCLHILLISNILTPPQHRFSARRQDSKTGETFCNGVTTLLTEKLLIRPCSVPSRGRSTEYSNIFRTFIAWASAFRGIGMILAVDDAFQNLPGPPFYRQDLIDCAVQAVRGKERDIVPPYRLPLRLLQNRLCHHSASLPCVGWKARPFPASVYACRSPVELLIAAEVKKTGNQMRTGWKGPASLA